MELFDERILKLKMTLSSFGIKDDEYFIGDAKDIPEGNLHIFDLTDVSKQAFKDSLRHAYEAERDNTYKIYSIINGKKCNYIKFNSLLDGEHCFIGLASIYHYIKNIYHKVDIADVSDMINKPTLHYIVNKLSRSDYCYWGIPSRSFLDERSCFDDTRASQNIWRYFYYERGGQYSIKIFDDEKSLCIYFFGVMASSTSFDRRDKRYD